MSEQNERESLWIVENDQTGATISKPCPRDIADQIYEWLTDFQRRRKEHTYVIRPATEDEVAWTQTFEYWCDDVVYLYLQHTKTLLDTDAHYEALFDMWTDGLMPDEAAQKLAS